jgi:ADP-dependent NAD(P)H-hydrate dehydratase / NAD(P)H-hydrate epimerase
MKPVVSANQMAELDAYAIKSLNVPGIILMENAGIGIVKACLKILRNPEKSFVQIFCGPGNNGGDGYVVARHLSNLGADVTVFILATRDKIKGDALTNLVSIENMALPVHYVEKSFNIQPCNLIVDAMLGTGVKGGLRGLFAKIVTEINKSGCPVLAVDIPTGVNADTGKVDGPAIKATATATMGCLKSGLLYSPGREYAGQTRVIDISMPSIVLQKIKPKTWVLEKADIKERLPQRAQDAFKNQCGTVAIIAGSKGFTGAAALASNSCLKAGAGLGYLAVPESLNAVMEAKLTEVITWPFDDANQGYLFSHCYDDLFELIKGLDVVAIGPGLGQHAETGKLVKQLLSSLSKPCVLDADGLNLMKNNIELFSNYKGELIVTPHPGELARIMNISTKEILTDKITSARHAASILSSIVVLKGGPTTIAIPDGDVYINSTGNSGMATAGSGDVLTGVISALMAQGLKSKDAAISGVYVHGLAGDIACQQKGHLGMVASDILENIPRALLQLQAGENEKN